jgi:hypothetical protein
LAAAINHSKRRKLLEKQAMTNRKKGKAGIEERDWPDGRVLKSDGRKVEFNRKKERNQSGKQRKPVAG